MDLSKQVISINSQNGGTFDAVPKDIPDPVPVEAMGFSYGHVLEIPERSVTIAKGTVSPGTEVPNHAGPNRYVMYVVAGQGQLVLYDKDGACTGRIAFAPGALIDFAPDAPHGWVVEGGEAFEWLGIDLSD